MGVVGGASKRVTSRAVFSYLQCSVSCGRGVETRDVTCVKKLGAALTIVSAENCDAANKPVGSQACERPACVSDWYITAWTQVPIALQTHCMHLL